VHRANPLLPDGSQATGRAFLAEYWRLEIRATQKQSLAARVSMPNEHFGESIEPFVTDAIATPLATRTIKSSRIPDRPGSELKKQNHRLLGLSNHDVSLRHENWAEAARTVSG
jgi:hypothetical protein